MVTETNKETYNDKIEGVVLYGKSTSDGALTAIKVNPATGAMQADTELTATIDPTGLATGAAQTTGNNSLSSIDGKLAKGDQTKASSLSVTPATDIADGRYIGDIKFGEELPAGTQILGKVGIDQVTAHANEVVAIGVTPGTAAASLGKAQGSAAGATDTGVAAVGKYEQQSEVTGEADGDYLLISLTDLKELRTRDQRHKELESCNAITGWAAVSDDAANIALAANHVLGTGAISFDKANGTANTVYATIGKTITSVNLSKLFSAGGFVGMAMYLSSLTNVVSVYLRLGTSASHYNQWKWPVAQLTAGSWMNLRSPVTTPDYSGNLGNGWNPAAITYVAVGVEFSGETNTLSGILVDHVHAVGGRVTSSTDAATTPAVTVVPNININKVNNSSTGVSGNGVVGAGTLRVTVANDSTGVVGLNAGEAHVGSVGGHTTIVTATLTRPNDTPGAYSAKDEINSSTSSPTYLTFTDVARVTGGKGIIVAAQKKTNNVAATSQIRLHLFNAAPTPCNDHAAYVELWADRNKYVGYIDFNAPSVEGTGSDMAKTQLGSVNLPFACVASKNLYGRVEVIVAGAAPAAQQVYDFTLRSLVD